MQDETTLPPKQEETPNAPLQKGRKYAFVRRYNDIYQMVRSALDISTSDEAIRRIAGRAGYDTPQLEEGETLADAYLSDCRRFDECLGRLEGMINAANKKRNEATNILSELRIRAQLAFKNKPHIFQLLNLHKLKSKTLGNWSAMASTFYNQLTQSPDIMSQLLAMGVTQEQITQGKATLDETLELHNYKIIALAEYKGSSIQKRKSWRK